ncbi:MAG: hypothetical protein ACK5VI_04210 [Opitutia bacterium]
MRPAHLTALLLTALLPICQAETAPAAQPAKPAATPTAPQSPAKEGELTADEQRLLRNARAKANKVPEIAAALKLENEAYRVAKEAKDAKKPKAEVDGLYAKARELRAAREAKRDAAILAASPDLKPLVEKAAARAKASPAASPAKPTPATKGGETKDDAGKDA